jgi:hypothetical protein
MPAIAGCQELILVLKQRSSEFDLAYFEADVFFRMQEDP